MEKKKNTKNPVREGKKQKGGKMTVFELYAPDAREVYLAGEFNNWDTRSLSMKKDSKGTWKKRMKLSSGRHEYKFFVDGNWVQDVPDAEKISNPYGTPNFIVNVQ